MQIRKLSHHEIETIVEYLQAMLDEMTSFGGHAFQNSDTGSTWLRDCIQSQINSPDHLFLGVELDPAPSQLIGILEASVAHLPPVFLPKLSLHIHAIYVVHTYRRSGVAQSLMESAFNVTEISPIRQPVWLSKRNEVAAFWGKAWICV